jgi:hypothetical protein
MMSGFVPCRDLGDGRSLKLGNRFWQSQLARDPKCDPPVVGEVLLSFQLGRFVGSGGSLDRDEVDGHVQTLAMQPVVPSNRLRDEAPPSEQELVGAASAARERGPGSLNLCD